MASSTAPRCPHPAPSVVALPAPCCPRTPTEGLLAGIWSEVLRVHPIGIHDDFFALGGHSLLATQVVARVRHTLNASLSLRDLFASPTIALLASLLRSAPESERHAIAGAIPRRQLTSWDEPPRASFAQQRLWFLDQLEPRSVAYNIPTAWRIRGPLDVGVLERGLNEVLARHEILRTTFAERDGQPVQIVSPPVWQPLPLTVLSSAAEAERQLRALLIEEAEQALDLSRGPLVRGRLFRLSPDEHVLLLTFHHVVTDGWSMDVFMNELSAWYAAPDGERSNVLPDLPIQYADYAAWQHQQLDGPRLEVHLSFWRRQLAGAPSALELPTDRPRPPAPSYQGAVVEFELGLELSRRLRQLCARVQSTPFMALAAVYALLLQRLGSQEDVHDRLPRRQPGAPRRPVSDRAVRQHARPPRSYPSHAALRGAPARGPRGRARS